MRTGTRMAVFAFTAALAAAVHGALAQEFPVRPLRLVVPSSPGGGTDTTARILSPKLTELFGQQVVVENRPGASTIIGMDAVARSTPDGYTLLIGNSTMTIIPSTHRKLPVDPVKDLAAVLQLTEVPLILVAHPSFPGKNFKEFLAIARRQPGKIDYAAGAYGGSGHMAMELLLHAAGIKVVYVPYKSGNIGLTDTLAGQVPVMMGSMLSILPHVKSGRLRAYGVTGLQRISTAPDIPTLSEAGLPGYQAIQWFGIFVPTGTSKEVISRIHGAFSRAVGDSSVRKQLINDGAEPHVSKSPEEFAAFVRNEVAKWAKVVKSAGIKQQ
jgi:tripartite-type tricarboxylate transporter receptor subunit TctC